MAWLLFMDESGQDRKNTPLEVRGGIAIHSNKIWDFVRNFHEAEKECFGVQLSEHKKEIKGSKLLAEKKYKWTEIPISMNDYDRRKAVRRFLTQTQQQTPLTQREFYAYGKACRLMAHRIFDLLESHDAKIFASAIPRDTQEPPDYTAHEYLRKDHIYLQQRFFDFLQQKKRKWNFGNGPNRKTK